MAKPKRENRIMDNRTQSFADVSSYLKYIESAPEHRSWSQISPARHNQRDHDWDLGVGFQGAIDMARQGWQAGVDKLQKIYKPVIPQGVARTRAYSVAGHSPCIGRFLSGAPDCMNTRIFSDTNKKPVIDITICPVAGSGVSGDNMLLFGAAIAEIIINLEASGYAINIDAAMIIDASMTDVISGSFISLKKSNYPLDMSRLIYFMAHPSFLRRLGFADFTHKLEMNKDTSSSLGRVMDFDDVKAILPNKESLIFCTNYDTMLNCTTSNAARKTVSDIVRAQRPDLITD